MQVFARLVFTLVVAFMAIPAWSGSLGFLDSERAVKTVKEGQRQFQTLDAWANQRSDEVEAVRNRVTELTQQLDSQRTVASVDAVRQLERDLLQAQRDLEDAARTLQRDYEEKRHELLAQVATRVRDMASEYAEANGFDAIFMLESQPLVYVAESVIITDEVIRLYDQRYPIN
jgi:Skp family chaperone for outer membrane proteins